MRVIKPGSGQRGWSTKTTCTGKGNGGGGCGAELMVEEADLYRTSSSHYDGSTDYYVTFTCPECGVETDLQNVPGNIESKIQGKKRHPPLATRTIPIEFVLGSGSQIKAGAIQDAIASSQIKAYVTPVGGTESGVNEQPLGNQEILRGAINRVMSAWDICSGRDAYIAVENGIFLEGENYLDYAVVLAFIPKFGQMIWVQSEAAQFPFEAVEKTLKKPGGFAKNTVGKTLQEMGLVKQHDDPHLDLVGKSRREILSRAVRELFNYLPRGLWLP